MAIRIKDGEKSDASSSCRRGYGTTFLFLVLLLLPTIDHLLGSSKRMNGFLQNNLISGAMVFDMSEVQTVSNRSSQNCNDEVSLPGIDAIDKLNLTTRPTIRPPQHGFAHSFWNSIQDAEDAYYGYNLSKREMEEKNQCSSFGGMNLMQALKDSKKNYFTTPATTTNSTTTKTSPPPLVERLEYFSANKLEVFMASSAVLRITTEEGKDPDISLQIPASDLKAFTAELETDSRFKTIAGKTQLAKATRELQGVDRQHVLTTPGYCDYTINHPVMLIDNDTHHVNWWFYHLELLKAFIVYTLFQPELVHDYSRMPAGAYSLQLYILGHYVSFERSHTDGLELLMADDVGLHKSVHLSSPFQPDGTRTFCFQDRLIWSPVTAQGGDAILLNRLHNLGHCFSAILTAYAAHIKASLHIPSLPTRFANGVGQKNEPRVLWVGRDMVDRPSLSPWQRRRLISNQDALVQYLQKKCRERGSIMDRVDFYGEAGQTSYQEQAHLASRANILIGIHGAGLNLDFFQPFNSVVLEIHLGTQGNKNSMNTLTHFGGGSKYMKYEGIKGADKKLDPDKVWSQLERAIQTWHNIQV